MQKILIANRGEIAVRIARTAAERGIKTVAVYSQDEAEAGHLAYCDHAYALPGTGGQAYLDQDELVKAALATGCDGLHPGYGFLSENAEFAALCRQNDIVFVGPATQLVHLFADKAAARRLAQDCGVPVITGTEPESDLDGIRQLLTNAGDAGAIVIKAVAGGGGRGMRIVSKLEDLSYNFERCQSEAEYAFGSGVLYAELYLPDVRHIEVQLAGDGDEVVHLWERECSIQRRHQKVLEVCPAIDLPRELRAELLAASIRMGKACGLDNLATFEFLVDASGRDRFFFIEGNPRIQVEHTVTEEVLGLDLVGMQLDLAEGRKLAELGISQIEVCEPAGVAMQLRIVAESYDKDGTPLPRAGRISKLEWPGGNGVRIDTWAKVGGTVSGKFDGLVGKLIVHDPGGTLKGVTDRARRALKEFRIDGVETNLALLLGLLDHPEFLKGSWSTRFVEQKIGELLPSRDTDQTSVALQRNDRHDLVEPDGDDALVLSPMTGNVVKICFSEGDRLATGDEIVIIESMKLEHAVRSHTSGHVDRLLVRPGEQVFEGQPIACLKDDGLTSAKISRKSPPANQSKPIDLSELADSIAPTLDAGRPELVEKRSKLGRRTARSNVLDLCDEGSFREFGQLAVAFMHSRKQVADLRRETPADGFVSGFATVNAEQFGHKCAEVAVGAYDATVLAGTQGHINHLKAERLFDLAGRRGSPIILFAEGGGGRPNEDQVTAIGMNIPEFRALAQQKGKVPVLGIASGRCFAGNAALLGIADTIIATEDSTIGMAGPAMVEAAGLGRFEAEEIGPIAVQTRNGVVDLKVKDEIEAVSVARRYLSFFQGDLPRWEAADPEKLREVLPEDPKRAYDVRNVIHLVADMESWLELRADFGPSLVTGLARVMGRPVGIFANNPMHDAGGIGVEGSEKASRFIQLCNAHNIPLLSLIDTPGFMVGPEVEAEGLVRHAARMFAAMANLRVPLIAIVLRRAFGLGAMAGAGGSFRAPVATLAWPCSEFGGMGAEGAVRIAYRRELEAIADEAERTAFFRARVDERRVAGLATNVAAFYEIDAVIDPFDTRTWVARSLFGAPGSTDADGTGFLDTW